MSPRAVASIHDVAPDTLPEVLRIVELLDGAAVPPVTLLVVPGRRWDRASLNTLRRLADAGHALAGHGWSHRAPEPRGLHHRLHAAVISRDQAEHLSRPRNEARRIVERCRAWFGRVGLPAPDLYVPPAWTLGALTRDDLRTLPFRFYETLTGFLDGRTGRRRTLPLVGFQADTRLRRRVLTVSNALNRGLARAWGRALRISLHPPDPGLHLARALERTLDRDWRWVGVEDVMSPGARSVDEAREPTMPAPP